MASPQWRCSRADTPFVRPKRLAASPAELLLPVHTQSVLECGQRDDEKQHRARLPCHAHHAKEVASNRDRRGNVEWKDPTSDYVYGVLTNPRTRGPTPTGGRSSTRASSTASSGPPSRGCGGVTGRCCCTTTLRRTSAGNS